MKGFSKSINKRDKKICKSDQTGAGKSKKKPLTVTRPESEPKPKKLKRTKRF